MTGAYISLADRFPEIEEVLLNPCGKVKLLNLYQTCRKMRKLARLMRFEAHPVWQAEVAKLQGASRGQGKKRKLCNSIVYSVDPASQYVPLEKPRKLNKASKRRETASKRKFLKLTQGNQVQKLSEDTVIASAWAQRASSVLKPGTIFSLAMPKGDEAQAVGRLLSQCTAQLVRTVKPSVFFLMPSRQFVRKQGMLCMCLAICAQLLRAYIA